MVYTKRNNPQTCGMKDISPVRNTNWSQATTGNVMELKLSSSPQVGYKLEVPQIKSTFRTSDYSSTATTNNNNDNNNNSSSNSSNNNKWFYNEMIRNDRDKFNSLHFA